MNAMKSAIRHLIEYAQRYDNNSDQAPLCSSQTRCIFEGSEVRLIGATIFAISYFGHISRMLQVICFPTGDMQPYEFIKMLTNLWWSKTANCKTAQDNGNDSMKMSSVVMRCFVVGCLQRRGNMLNEQQGYICTRSSTSTYTPPNRKISIHMYYLSSVAYHSLSCIMKLSFMPLCVMRDNRLPWDLFGFVIFIMGSNDLLRQTVRHFHAATAVSTATFTATCNTNTAARP